MITGVEISRRKSDLWGLRISENAGVKVLLWGEIHNLQAVLSERGLGDVAPERALALLVAQDRASEYMLHFNGQFLLAAEWLETRRRLIATDRCGTIRLYYAEVGGNVAFCDSIWQLQDRNRWSLAHERVVSSMLFGYYIGDGTWLEGVRVTMPATIYTVSEGAVCETRYSIPKRLIRTTGPMEEAAKDFHEKWMTAVERWTRSLSGPTLLPLSGGLDSRLILASMMELGCNRKIVTCTWGGTGTFDFEIGRLVGAVAGTRNIALPIDYRDWDKQMAVWVEDNEGMIACLPYFPVLEYRDILKGFSDVMSGFMGDPTMGSHVTNDMVKQRIPAGDELLNMILDTHAWPGLSILSLIHKYGTGCVGKQLGLVQETIEKCPTSSLLDLCEDWDRFNRQMKYTSYAVFRFRDRVRYRCPFMDNSVQDFMASVAPQWLYKQRFYTYYCSKYFPRMFSLPTKMRLGAPLTWAPWQYCTYSVAYRSIRYLKRRLYPRQDDYYDTCNYLDYDRHIPRSEAIQNALSPWQKWGDIMPVDIEDSAWREVKAGTACNSALVMLVTNRMARKQIGVG